MWMNWSTTMVWSSSNANVKCVWFRSANMSLSETTFHQILSPKCCFFFFFLSNLQKNKTGRNPYIQLLRDRLQMINHLTAPSFMAVKMIFSSPVACSSSVGIPGKLIISTCVKELIKPTNAKLYWTTYLPTSAGAELLLFWLLVSAYTECIVLHGRRNLDWKLTQFKYHLVEFI